VDRQRYADLRSETIEDGKNKKKEAGPSTNGRKVIDSEKSVIHRIGKAKKMFRIHRKRVVKYMFSAVVSEQ
jgi:hypothetical protein